MDIAINPETGRLPVQVVEHLHRLLGGDARLERMVLSGERLLEGGSGGCT